jgi:hypothetical protein
MSLTVPDLRDKEYTSVGRVPGREGELIGGKEEGARDVEVDRSSDGPRGRYAIIPGAASSPAPIGARDL